MKFILEGVKSGCRLGRIVEPGPSCDKIKTTPLCMLYTIGGSAPYLTRDMLNRIRDLPVIIHLPLVTMAEHEEVLAEYQKGIKSFTVMQSFLAYCSVQDSARAVPPGYNDKFGIAVWTRGGKRKLDMEKFMKIQKSFKPDFYQTLCDSDTDLNSSNKRLKKSVDRTIEFLDKCLEEHKKSEELKNTKVFGALVGGYSLEERMRCVREVIKRPVDGYTIEGFHAYGPSTESFSLTDIKDILHQIMAELPADKPRLMHQVWAPDAVLDGILAGIDIFDSSYTYIVTERGSALSFNYQLQPPMESTASHGNTSESSAQNPTMMVSSGSSAQNPATTSSSETTQENNKEIQNKNEADDVHRPFEISLKNKSYFADFGPLVEGCTCYTCSHHTRAYLHHLLTTSELLAGALLTIHNVHHYNGYFWAIRAALESNNFSKLQELIRQQR